MISSGSNRRKLATLAGATICLAWVGAWLCREERQRQYQEAENRLSVELAAYAERWVAVGGHKVLDSDEDVGALLARRKDEWERVFRVYSSRTILVHA